jgi:hypothetical protein
MYPHSHLRYGSETTYIVLVCIVTRHRHLTYTKRGETVDKAHEHDSYFSINQQNVQNCTSCIGLRYRVQQRTVVIYKCLKAVLSPFGTK